MPNQKDICISLKIFDDTEVLVHDVNQFISAGKALQAQVITYTITTSWGSMPG